MTQSQKTKFERLDSERYTDNGHAHQYSSYYVFEREQQTAENNPYYIAKYFHYNVLYIPNAGYLKKQVQDLRAFLILTTYSFLRTSRGMEFIVWRRLRRVLEGSSMTAFSIFSIDISLMRMELPHI